MSQKLIHCLKINSKTQTSDLLHPVKVSFESQVSFLFLETRLLGTGLLLWLEPNVNPDNFQGQTDTRSFATHQWAVNDVQSTLSKKKTFWPKVKSLLQKTSCKFNESKSQVMILSSLIRLYENYILIIRYSSKLILNSIQMFILVSLHRVFSRLCFSLI